jgi:hypothetical protein
MILKGEAILVVSDRLFYADGCAGTTVRLCGAAIPPHLFGKAGRAIWREKSLKFSPSLADIAGKPKFRLGSASQIETLAIADVASPMWEQASSCLG